MRKQIGEELWRHPVPGSDLSVHGYTCHARNADVKWEHCAADIAKKSLSSSDFRST